MSSRRPMLITKSLTSIEPLEGWGMTIRIYTNSLTREKLIDNSFCPTGEGGGIDPTCGKNAQSRLDSESRVTRGGVPKKDGEWIKNPIPRTEGNLETDMEVALSKDAKEAGVSMKEYLKTMATEETVSVELLKSGQGIIDPKSVAHFIKSPPSELPLIVQYGPHLIVRDGNTRIAAQILGGKERIKARVLFVQD